MTHYRPFWDKGVQVDIVDMDGDISKYKLVIAPMLYMYRAGFEKKMRKFVENGGTLVTTYWSGIVDDTDLCKMGGLPGDMMDVFGVWNEEIDSLPDGMKNGIAFNGSRYDAIELCARIHPLTAEVLGTYEKDFYAGEAALTKNKFGKGEAYYIAARTGSDMLSVLYGEMIETLHIEKALDCALPHGVTAHIRHGEKGEYHFCRKLHGKRKNRGIAARLQVVRYRSNGKFNQTRSVWHCPLIGFNKSLIFCVFAVEILAILCYIEIDKSRHCSCKTDRQITEYAV